LSKRYPELVALDQCSLSIREGEVFGLLGPNGAGKTTLIRLLMGFLKPSSGRASISGLDCYEQRVAAHQLIAYLPGDARLFRTMRGRQVLKFFSGIRADTSFRQACDVAERLELDLSRWVAFMSTGMRQKLALAAVLSVRCPLLILDEPTSNLDPNVRAAVTEMILEARDAGRTVVFSSHILSEIEETCDRVAILRSGKLVHTQSMDTLKRKHRITARLRSELPVIPNQLQGQMTVTALAGQRIQIETPGELSLILKWLAEAELDDVFVQPVGLRSVYDRFHHQDGSAVSEALDAV
jgi:ABC-2 type transport system ATP-binding protein